MNKGREKGVRATSRNHPHRFVERAHNLEITVTIHTVQAIYFMV